MQPSNTQHTYTYECICQVEPNRAERILRVRMAAIA